MEREESGRPNKSALKRAAKQVEATAEQAVAQADELLARLELGEPLRAEIELAASVRQLGARKRQVKHLAGLLRKRPDQLAQIEVYLAGESERHLAEQAQFHKLERWRDALCDPETVAATLAEILDRFPEADRNRLEALSRSACQGDKKAFRELFRVLRRISENQEK